MLQEAQHFVWLPVPDVKGWFLEELQCLLREDILGVVSVPSRLVPTSPALKLPALFLCTGSDRGEGGREGGRFVTSGVFVRGVFLLFCHDLLLELLKFLFALVHLHQSYSLHCECVCECECVCVCMCVCECVCEHVCVCVDSSYPQFSSP